MRPLHRPCFCAQRLRLPAAHHRPGALRLPRRRRLAVDLFGVTVGGRYIQRPDRCCSDRDGAGIAMRRDRLDQSPPMAIVNMIVVGLGAAIVLSQLGC